MINCILLVLLLFVSMVLLKCTRFPLVVNLLNFIQFFHLKVFLIMILPVSSVIFFDQQYLMITLLQGHFFLFVSQIKNANLSCKRFVSYNVASLFTNIPLQETIDIAIYLIFNHNPNVYITKTEFKKLLLFATSQIHFLFSGKFYNQIDRVAMGSVLPLVLPNVFMGFFKSIWLNFLNSLNNEHSNIKLLIKKQVNHSIALLAVFISGIDNQNLIIQPYHKSTYTRLLLNCKSFTSF